MGVWSTNGRGVWRGGSKEPLKEGQTILEEEPRFSRRPEVQSSHLQPAPYASWYEKPHASDKLCSQTWVKRSSGQSGHSMNLSIEFTFTLAAPSCQVEISVLVRH